MGNEAQESLYREACEKTELLEVLVSPEAKADECKTIAGLFLKAGDYKDAKELSGKFGRMADEYMEEGRALKYERACRAMEKASSTLDYDHAIDSFKELKGYKDAEEKKELCRKKKLHTIKVKNIELAVKAAVLAVAVVAALFLIRYARNSASANEKEQERLAAEAKQQEMRPENAGVGEQVLFGKYAWTVLDKTETEALLLGAKPETFEEFVHTKYNDTLEDVTWETSSMRAWLNGSFLENGFSEEERERILLTDVHTPDNETYGTDGGNDTQDYVYLLSIEEAQQYYEIIQNMWWNYPLRSPGNAQNTMAYMGANHAIMDYGYPVDSENFFIRPVIRIQLDTAEK